MLELIRVMIVGGVLVLVTFLVLLALPQCKLREALKPWAFVLGCVAYIFCPTDFLPELVLGPLGLLDDAGALVAAMFGIRSALAAKPAVTQPVKNRPVA